MALALGQLCVERSTSPVEFCLELVEKLSSLRKISRLTDVLDLSQSSSIRCTSILPQTPFERVRDALYCVSPLSTALRRDTS